MTNSTAPSGRDVVIVDADIKRIQHSSSSLEDQSLRQANAKVFATGGGSAYQTDANRLVGVVGVFARNKDLMAGFAFSRIAGTSPKFNFRWHQGCCVIAQFYSR